MVDPAIDLVLLSLVALGASCGEGVVHVGPMQLCPDANTSTDMSGLLPGSDTDATRQPPPGQSRAVRIRCLRDALMKTIADSPCPGNGCEMVSFQPVLASPSPASEGARILLIDEAIVTVAATRYQSRTLAYLTHDADGTYQSSGVTIQIAKDALSVFQAVDRFGGPLASEEIDISGPFATKFDSKIPNWAGHGTDILPFLEDRIPRAQFVVSEALLDYPLNDPQICGVNDSATSESAVQRLEAQLLHTEQSLSSLIQQYSISYIHLSWGITRSEIAQSLQSRCGVSPPGDVSNRIQAAYLKLLKALGSLSVTLGGQAALRGDPSPFGRAAGQSHPVLLFQAGTGANREIHADDPDFLTDCTAFPGRLRIFSAAYTGLDIPVAGSTDPKYVTPFAQRVIACLDLMVNVGYVNPWDVRMAPTFFPSSSLGLGVASRPGWPAVSSFANPVGLAYFAYLAEQHPDEMEPQLMAHITNQWTKPAVDPLLYGLFPRPFQQQ